MDSMSRKLETLVMISPSWEKPESEDILELCGKAETVEEVQRAAAPNDWGWYLILC